MTLKEFDNSYGKVIGVDEAGRGPLAGPVVSAAVYVINGDELEEVDDSKKISEKRREIFFDKIINNCEVGVGIVSAKDIDKINILNATMESMRIALSHMKEAVDIVLVDGNTKIKNYYGSQLPVVKGDSKSLAIAAASIIAKVTRDKIMKEISAKYPQYLFEKHKGYGTQSHIEAIRKFGPCEIHRMSFIKKILKEN
ncbi:MAG TPA: ribonuclease HII [Fusobacteria bacterium]|nr:ribonuclease HII [Fusobacteriota bacterium]|tara:strand:+ start:5630 stop:6220 length:591 start_codon:yes stop_codon:yes gene_type:complete